MPDIAMCKGLDDTRTCPKRDRCHRFTAKPNGERQAYFGDLPFVVEAGEVQCPYFTPNGAKP